MASTGNVILIDVTSHTLGILANRADMVPIMAKDCRIPGAETKDNFVNGGGAKEINVQIFQGENPVAYENDLIGTLPIILPEEREQGHYRFAVTFALDVHGLLKVSVKCLNDDQIWQTELQCDVRATKEQVEKSSRDLADVFAADDRAGPAPAAGKPADVPGPPSGLPKPPGGLPRPPGGLPTPPGQAAADAVPPPPADTPDEFKSAARRVFKLIPQLSGADRDRLTVKYRAFTAAVQAGSPDVEDLGDELYDLFREVKG
jgi:molecular chaperone DnaK